MEAFIFNGIITDSTPGHEASELQIWVMADGTYQPAFRITVAGAYYMSLGDWVAFPTMAIVPDPPALIVDGGVGEMTKQL